MIQSTRVGNVSCIRIDMNMIIPCSLCFVCRSLYVFHLSSFEAKMIFGQDNEV